MNTLNTLLLGTYSCDSARGDLLCTKCLSNNEMNELSGSHVIVVNILVRFDSASNTWHNEKWKRVTVKFVCLFVCFVFSLSSHSYSNHNYKLLTVSVEARSGGAKVINGSLILID